MQRISTKYQKGFTLIELLVVIAIIGILASVVLASLNTARAKGTEAAIKSNLKNMIPQAELAYVNNYSTVCADAKITSMITAINNTGGAARCSSFSTDNYIGWGASAKNSDGTKNWSVDNSGVVDWDTTDVPGGFITWDAANTACTASGGRLPTIEQLIALSLAYSPVTVTIPPGFIDRYWSSVTDVTTSTQAYYIYFGSGGTSSEVKTNATRRARCVH